jgi:hypothetical protein
VVTAETEELLLRHAGLSGDPLDPSSVSGAISGGESLDRALDSFMNALQRLNVDLNGPKPSEVVAESNDGVSRRAAYAVAEVSRMLRDAGTDDAAWLVDTAWLAILAGDVDDVACHVALERRAGSPESSLSPESGDDTKGDGA